MSKAGAASPTLPWRRWVSVLTGSQGSPAREREEQATQRRREAFLQLAGEWRRATAISSSPTEKAMHPSYQRIIGMGPAAVSWILSELSQKPEQWFWALKAITGEDPVAEEQRGNVRAMTSAWLDWGRERGYL